MGSAFLARCGGERFAHALTTMPRIYLYACQSVEFGESVYYDYLSAMLINYKLKPQLGRRSGKAWTICRDLLLNLVGLQEPMAVCS